MHGTSGRITFWYKQDRVLVQRAGHGPEEIEYHRTDLLENLVDHLVDGADLLVPPEVTGAFMKVVEAIRVAPTRSRSRPRPGTGCPTRTAGSSTASTAWSWPPPTTSPSTPNWAPPGRFPQHRRKR